MPLSFYCHFPCLSVLISSYFRLFSGSTHRERINVGICSAVSARQPVTYFITERVKESSQVLDLFIRRNHSLTMVKFQQQPKNHVSFHIPFLAEQYIILNHFSFMFSVCHLKKEKNQASYFWSKH